jgi:DNA primase
MRGIQNVIATSGTAFTEQQVGLLRRQTTNVVVNFDPDAAGANAAEKSISLLTEEGFNIKVVTLDGGLDPDRFIRERGVEAYAGAIRGARRQSDYLIERARQSFPGSSAEAKIKAMNYLLPHIRRIPQKLERAQFAEDAAQKLGIDTAVLREELRTAAIKRQDHVESRPSVLTEVERVLLRALAITSPEFETSRQTAVEALQAHPERFEHLASYPCMVALAHRQTTDPMDAVTDSTQRALLAEVLLAEVNPPAESVIHHALLGIDEQALAAQRRAVIARIAEAEARGDFEEVVRLTQQKMNLDRQLRKLHED